MLPCAFREKFNDEYVCLFGVPGKHETSDEICTKCQFGNQISADKIEFFNICHFLDLRITNNISNNNQRYRTRCMKNISNFNCSTCNEKMLIAFKGGINLGGINPHEFEFIRKKEILRKELLEELTKYNKIMKKCFITGGECSKNIIIEKNSVFVALRHSPQNENVYKYGIEPALKDLGLKIFRAKDLKLNIDFMCKICEQIQRSEYVLADVSEETITNISVNSSLDEFSKTAFNVGYELGISHGLGKETFILRKENSKEHQDIKRNEAILYSDDYEKLKSDIVTMFQDTKQYVIERNS
jgi:hypothetical protein